MNHPLLMCTQLVQTVAQPTGNLTYAYDAIGNPLNDGKWDYSWVQGRQLRSMYKGEFGEADYDELTFEYNADGLRTKKERMYCNERGSIAYQGIDYTLHGKNIVHLADNEHEMHFFYDAQNKPAVALYDGVAYAYMYSLQGDVIALVDANGTPVVEYRYDAWGKPLSKTGTLATTLGTLNPFRYRGYMYDEETGLYYLQNRYYSALFSRFISPDIEIGKNYPLAHDIFTYCLNSPVNRIDRNGNDSYAIGSVFSGSFAAAASFASGYCWDDEGNFGVYYTFVGVDYDIEQVRESPTIGIGGFSASMGLAYQVYPQKSIKDLAGPGTYYGFGTNAFGYSLGFDGINTLSRDETFADTVRDNRAPDGYQYSFNLGVGSELAHAGTSNTYIMLILEKGKYILPWLRKLVNYFPSDE